MLSSIEFERYRGFERFRLAGLSRVNLLVGKNNCGKTTALEGVHLLASGGDPGVLARTAWERGEMVLLSEEGDRRSSDAHPDISHFFHGHHFGPDAYFKLSSDDGFGRVRVAVKHVAESDLKELPLFGDMIRGETGSLSTYAVQFEGSSEALRNRPLVFPVSENGAFPIRMAYRYRRIPRPLFEDTGTVQFITPDSLEPRSMNEMWDKALVDGREEEVIKAMQILEPDLVSLAFLTGERSYRGKGGVVVGFERQRGRIPLGSHGDGMRRLLGLSLSLIRTEGGVLLVDEIDTGLHWSIMGDMWLLVVKAAQQTDVQVFATTHSLDCVRGLAWLCSNHEELADEVSLQKMDRNLDEAVALQAEQIVVAAEQDIEVR